MIHARASIVLSLVLAGPAWSQVSLLAPAAGSPVVVGEGSGTAILRDLNRDGRPDLLTRHLLTRRIGVFRGDGAGGFTPLDSIVTEYEPGDMELGDMNRDGVIDLVVTSNNRDFVDLYLGNGRGGFRLATGSPFTVSRIIDTYNKRTLHLLDLNEDGNLDVATANGRLRNTVRTLLGNGRGGFTAGPIIQLDTRGDGFVLAFGDVDGDRHLDVVSASGGLRGSDDSPGRVVLQRGDGRGNFRSARSSSFRTSAGAASIMLADLNADSRTDIVLGHQTNQVSVLFNQTGGGFEPAEGSPFEVAGGVYGLVTADVNGDKQPDVVAATVNSVTVLLGNGRSFEPASGSPFKAGPGAYNLASGDINRDGKPDIVATSFEGNGVTVLLAN
jgi:FG-GAP-like repeat